MTDATMMVGPLAATVAYAHGRGVTMAQITAATGLRLRDLLDPEARVPETSMPALWRLLGEIWPGEALALDMAAAAPWSVLGVLRHAAGSAPDLRSALEILVEYQSVLSTSVCIEVHEHGDGASLVLHHPMDELDGGHAAELGLAVGVRFGREFLGLDTALVRVEFSHAPFGPLADYEDFFGVPVRFERASNALVLERHALDSKLAQRDPRRLYAWRGPLALMRERLDADQSLLDLAELRTAIAHNAAGREFGPIQLARSMGTSLRTLQRRAADRGTTLHALLEEARAQRARCLLVDPHMKIFEVAHELGYATESAFRRAFRRWTGESPGRFRGHA